MELHGKLMPRHELLLDFGKHKRKHIDQVDDGYLQWMLRSFPESSQWQKAAASALTSRGKLKQQGEAEQGSVHALLLDLKSCSKKRDLQWGRRIHAKAVECRSDTNIYVATALIKMYASCGSMVETRKVFDSIQKPDVVSWTALLLGYAEKGEGQACLELFSKMKAGGCAPDSVTYVAALKACSSLALRKDKPHGLEMGRRIHAEIGDHLNVYVQNALIDMYSKCGSMADARQVFDSMQKTDNVSWNALLLGYAEDGEGNVSLDLFFQMKANGCAPDSLTYVAALKACSSLAVNGAKAHGLEMGSRMHSEIGDHLNTYVQNTLIDMYANCGSMVDARQVFDGIQKPGVVAWTALLLGYAENGKGDVTLGLFPKMKADGCVPNHITYVAVLKACGSTGSLALGRKLHSDIREFTDHVVTSLVDFYAKCGSMVEARAVFDLHTRVRGITTWNALLAGYSSCGDTGEAFKLFEAMQDMGLQPDGVTFVCMLLCCSHAGLLMKARQYLEAMPVKYGVTPDVVHYSCVVDALGRTNQLMEAVSVLRAMPCNPNAVTWSALLGACRKWKNAELGRIAFQSWVEMDKEDASAYVLMANIYGSRRMWEEQAKVLESRTKHGLPGQAYVVDEVGKMVTFLAGKQDSSEVKEKLAQLLKGLNEQGYAASSISSTAGAQKDEALCGHFERSAVVYGILKTPPGEPVRAFKNTRMCDECHETAKVFSKLSRRVIMVRDASRFHVMVDGSCSCGDYF